MSSKIQDLLKQIQLLEDQLSDAVLEQQQKARFHWEGKKVAFEHSITQTHRKLKKNLFRTLFIDRPQNFLTSPIIYGMAVPLVIFDILISFYQYTCFPVYGVARVKRRQYFIYDRGQLQYLNFIQKLNCQYCAYGNGLMAYSSEIIARTEQYFCPIKPAKKRLGAHRRYEGFSAFGDAEHFEQEQKRLRKQLRKLDQIKDKEAST